MRPRFSRGTARESSGSKLPISSLPILALTFATVATEHSIIRFGDFIQMPVFDAFVSAETHAGVLAHECVHWTMAGTRLDRNLGCKKWGDEGYAKEELVAELGSVFLSADLGIAIEPREDHAAYIASWLKCLKSEKRAVFQMAAHAERAVAYLHGLQPGSNVAIVTEGKSAAA